MYVMGGRHQKKRRLSWIAWVLFGLAGLVVLFAAGGLGVRQTYLNGLKPVDSSIQEAQTITIESGTTTEAIAKQLKDAGLIRSAWVFRWYVGRSGAQGSLQAGTYELSPSQSVEQIVAILSHGKVKANLITILPGQRLSSIREMLISEGFSERDVDAALNPANYTGHPALVDKPIGASLEGYLYPESFHKTSATTPQTIIKQSLDEMAEALTPDIRAGIQAQGLTVHDSIILASIVGKEVSDNKSDERPKVAQVFLKRLKIGMKLQSDTTNNYPPSFDTYSITGLPPEPLSNVTKSALAAVAAPANTDYLYFVTGRDCVTRFSATLAEHEAFIRQHGAARAEDHCT
jgi:UPF0755 protein